MRRQLNVKFLAQMLATLVVLGAGVHFLHGFQLKRNAHSLLLRADEAESNKEFGKSLGYLGRYLGFHPTDAEVLARFGLLLDQEAKNPRIRSRAFFILEEALRADPEREDVRRRVIKTAMALNRFTDAKDHLKVLLKDFPDDLDLVESLARCEEAGARFEDAGKLYKKVIDGDRKRIDCYVRLAKIYRRLDKPGDAKELMVLLEKRMSESIQARLALGAYYREIRLLPEANIHIGYAREKLAPDDISVLLDSAELVKKDKPEEARAYLERGLKKHPEELRLHLGLAELELRARRPAKAIERLNDALKVLPDRADLIWTTAALFLDAGAPEETKKLLDRLGQEEWQPAANYLRARMLLAEDKVGAARTLLEKQRQALAESPELAREADISLGVCYERLGNPDKQLEAFHRAATGAASNEKAQLGLAAALVANDRLDEAITEYRKLMTSEMPSARLMVVRLLIVRNLRLAAGLRKWDSVEELLKQAPPEVRDTVDYNLLGVDLLVVRGKVKEAREVLEKACQKEPKEVRYWLGLTYLVDRDEKADPKKPFAEAFQLLDKAEKQLGDSVELRLARASRLARMPAEQAKDALGNLEKNADKFSKAEQASLMVGLAEAYQRQGDSANARRLLGTGATLLPFDMGIRLRLFDLTLAANDDEAAQALQEKIKDIEGEEGSLWRWAEAARLAGKAFKGDRTRLDLARRRLDEVAKSRPNLSRVPLLRAEIDDLVGNQDAALEGYQRALDLGEQNPHAISRAVQHLTARRRFDEAKQLLDRGQERAVVPADFNRLAASVSLLSNDSRERTLELAERAVAKDSKDYRDQLFHGQLLWSIDKRQEAEAAFRQAVALDPKAPETWAVLVTFLAGTEKKQQAETEIENAKRVLPADKAAQALAVCYEAVGQRDKAEEQYKAQLKDKPRDAAVLRGIASFYLRAGETNNAKAPLKKLIDSSGGGSEVTVRWARRSLAMALAGERDYQKSRQALQLIEENLQEHPDAPEDQRARAVVLAMQPGGRRESIRALESSYARLRPTPGEQLLLAQLYEANRDWDRANEQLLALLNTKGGDAPAYLAYYVRALLRQDQAVQAEFWLDRLKKKDPGTAQTLELTARVWAKLGKGQDAAKLIRDYVVEEFTKKKEPEPLAGGARLLAELKLDEGAEGLYRQYVKEASAKKPECVLLLAGFLAQRKRLSEALDLCEGAWLKCKPEAVAAVCVNALLDGQPGERDYQRVERSLEGAMKQHPEVQLLPMALANVLVMQERLADAEKLYRSVHARNPSSQMVLNNLAWLLAMHAGKKEEGLNLITRAIEINGPAANLLDTRGKIHLVSGQTDQAIKDLEDAVAERPQPIYFFHLAQAHLQANNLNAAKQAWQKAQELNLSEKNVLRVEIAEYKKLQDLFQSK